jgi:two-component system, LuxR family, response regulator FixJ
VCALQRLLASDGLDAQTFDSPEGFLDYARKQQVRLVLLYVSMPEMDGIEVQRKLREFSPQTRTIMMTGRETGDSRCRVARRRFNVSSKTVRRRRASSDRS